MKIRKWLKSIACFLLAGVALFSVAACKEKLPDEVPEPSDDDPVYEETGANLVENNASDYTIVIPEGRDYTSVFAANELNYFLELSTGVELPVIEDAGLVFDRSQKYISIGETALAEGAGIEVSREELGTSGYILKTEGNVLFIAAPTASTYNGSLYGVYDVLEASVGYKFYASDEIVYNTLSTVPLYKFDETVVPSVSARVLAYKTLDDTTYASRLRTIENSTMWSSFTHTLIRDYLPYSTYGAAHPDWYVNGGQQLCCSNEEMIAELILRVEEKLARYPETTHVMLGHEDNNAFCNCAKCKATIEKYGGCAAGVELEMTNKVAEAVDQWLAANYPGRTVKYVFFAYGPTMNSPMTYDDATGEFTKNFEDTYIYENTGVMLAPIGFNFARAPQDAENQSLYRTMLGWSELFGGEDLYVWHYSLASYGYMFQMNNFGVQKQYYEFYEDLGVNYIYDQGYYDTSVCTFEQMRLYISSALLWDTSLSYDELANEFITQYYGPAAEYVREYYYFLRAYLYSLEQKNSGTGTVFFTWEDKNLWPLGVVNTLLSQLDGALGSLEPLKESDPARYEVLYARVQRERLSPLYMMLQFYIDQLSDSVRASYIDDFETYSTTFEIIATREGSMDIASVIDAWKKV